MKILQQYLVVVQLISTKPYFEIIRKSSSIFQAHVQDGQDFDTRGSTSPHTFINEINPAADLSPSAVRIAIVSFELLAPFWVVGYC